MKFLRDKGHNAEKVIQKLEADNHNHVEQDDANFEDYFTGPFIGLFKRYDNYLLIHTVVVDDDDKVWSIYWIDEEEIDRKEITYKEVRFPYRIHKLNPSDRSEYYGMFRDVIESQRAVNQALLKIQAMVNSQKAIIQEGSVADVGEFTDAFNRVNSVMVVKNLAGIRIENLHKDVLDQYKVIDSAFDRVKRILGINDSFLGDAFASDSGRKLKLQQNSTILALRYTTSKIEDLYRLLGEDIIKLVKQYYTANEALRIADDSVAEKWRFVRVNAPLQIMTGNVDETGQPEVHTPFEEVLDPESEEPMVDEEGNRIMAPIPQMDTEIAFSDVDVAVESIAYDDQDEKNQLLIENVLNGAMGQTLSQLNPAEFLRVCSMSVRNVRTKNSMEIADIFEKVANMVDPIQQQMSTEYGLQQQLENPQQGGSGAGSPDPRSQQLKLPTNTNEPV